MAGVSPYWQEPSLRLFWLALAGLAAGAQAQESVTLHYYERPPYAMPGLEGDVGGLIADRVTQAMTRTTVPFSWRQTPAKRLLALIESNRGRDCGVGWYKTPERELIAQFSKPVYIDHPAVAIVRPSFGLAPGTTLRQVFDDPRLRLLMKDGLTYGAYMRGLMASYRAQVQVVTVEQVQMVRMIAAGRADMMFGPQEEARYLVSHVDPSLRILNFPDAPAGEARYLMCSKRVDPLTLALINAALDARAGK